MRNKDEIKAEYLRVCLALKELEEFCPEAFTVKTREYLEERKRKLNLLKL